MVLANKSEVFARMLKSGLRDAQKQKVEIKEHETDVVMWMLLFIYRGSFRTRKDFNSWLLCKGRDPAVTFALVYAIAVEYMVDGMERAALQQLHYIFRMRSFYDFGDWIQAIRIAYTNTPENRRGLRKPLIQKAKRHRVLFDSYTEFEDLVKTYGNFAWDLLKTDL